MYRMSCYRISIDADALLTFCHSCHVILPHAMRCPCIQELLLRYGLSPRLLWYRANIHKLRGHIEHMNADLEMCHSMSESFVQQYVEQPLRE